MGGRLLKMHPRNNFIFIFTILSMHPIVSKIHHHPQHPTKKSAALQEKLLSHFEFNWCNIMTKSSRLILIKTLSFMLPSIFALFIFLASKTYLRFQRPPSCLLRSLIQLLYVCLSHSLYIYFIPFFLYLFCL